MPDALSYIDLASLALIALLLVLALMPRLRRQRRRQAAYGPTLVGSAALDVDETIVDTNDALYMAVGEDNDYLGPDQTSLALALLDPPESYAALGGFIPADLALFLVDSPPPERLGSTDPAAAPALFLLDRDARLLERGLEQPDPPYLYPLVGTIIALIALVPLVLRLFP